MDEYIVYIFTFMAVVIPTILYCLSDKSVKVAKAPGRDPDSALPFMLQAAEPFANAMDKIGLGEIFLRLWPKISGDFDKKIEFSVTDRSGKPMKCTVVARDRADVASQFGADRMSGFTAAIPFEREQDAYLVMRDGRSVRRVRINNRIVEKRNSIKAKRLERKWKAELSKREAAIKGYEEELHRLKQERKTRSAALQLKLFRQFRMQNALGEEKDLCELFAPTPQRIPPAGAGECAAPKLLQYAYLHQLHPLAMAEFWWGDSPVTEIRKHGHYYPACKGKCAPILTFMLQGLDVEENPLTKDKHTGWSPDIVYEDEDLLVVNKPAGILSVPGKEGGRSLIERIRDLYPDAQEWQAVHRLDMATSGLLLFAKNKRTYQHLQAQFKNKTVKKRYVAWLDGIVPSDSGSISLPLCPDWMNRPRQMVNHTDGKPAQTRYEVLCRTEKQTRIAFYPLTGRTHQLRVHAASVEGLNAPITGDELYGTKSDRLYLHAESIEFVHPRTGKRIHIEKSAPF